jgi:hypothetical protein
MFFVHVDSGSVRLVKRQAAHKELLPTTTMLTCLNMYAMYVMHQTTKTRQNQAGYDLDFGALLNQMIPRELLHTIMLTPLRRY